MTEYLTEQEQIDLLKGWIKQYSLVIIAGVIMAAAAISGWRYWQQRQTKTLNHASAIYDEVLTMRAQNDTNTTIIQAKKLFSHYPHTTYASMAALMLARDAILRNNFDEAQSNLNWVLTHSKVPSFRQIARLRLARVLVAIKKPAEALKLLEKTDDQYFNGLTEEVKGDAYLAMNNLALARTAYQQALTDLPNAEVIRPLLQMKYDNLAP